MILVTGCKKEEKENYKETILNSISYLNEPTYYIIHGSFSYEEYEKEISLKFDEQTNIIEKTTSFKEPYSDEYIKFNDNSITRIYGLYEKNEELENSYYINNWTRENLQLTEENIEKYTYLNKEFFIEMFNNALEYEKNDQGYYVLISKEYINKIIKLITEENIAVTENVYIDIIINENNLDLFNFTIPNSEKDYENNRFYIGFQTEFDKEPNNLELPETC